MIVVADEESYLRDRDAEHDAGRTPLKNRPATTSQTQTTNEQSAITLQKVSSLRRGLLHVASCKDGCDARICRSTRRLLARVEGHQCRGRSSDCRAWSMIHSQLQLLNLVDRECVVAEPAPTALA